MVSSLMSENRLVALHMLSQQEQYAHFHNQRIERYLYATVHDSLQSIGVHFTCNDINLHYTLFKTAARL